MARHYCTYFDHRYLDRGLALHESLSQHDPGSTLWVLSLSDECTRALKSAGRDRLVPVPLSELERHDPNVAATRCNRSLIEYYFTLSPAWPRYLLHTQPHIELLTYLDADLYFFSDPSTAFREFEDATIAASPHRFPKRLQHLEAYGHFNVGWLTYRRSAEALRFLDWWRERCIEWCHDRLEAGRFADQKYLDQAPDMFSGFRSIAHPGINLAPWNVESRSLVAKDERLFVDDDHPLIAYHFHGVKRIADRRYDCNLADYQQRLRGLLRLGIYLPYLRKLESLRTTTTIPTASNIRHGAPIDWRESIRRRIKTLRSHWLRAIVRV